MKQNLSLFDILNALLLTLFTASVLIPFLNIIAISLSSRTPILRGDVGLWPVGWTLDSYGFIAKNQMIVSGYRNTIIIVIVGTVLSLVMTVLTAFPLSRAVLWGKTPLTVFLAITMWFSGGMIPSFLVVRSIGLYDTLWALIIPGCLSAYNVFIVRNFFADIPDSLEDAAQIDGCGDLRMLFTIFLPLSTPVLATIALWAAVGYWNNYLSGILYIRTSAKYPLQVVLRSIVLSGTDLVRDLTVEDETNVLELSLKYAAIIFTTLPILCVYPFLQRYFVKGIMVGSIKG
ncbi:MAG: carbohydrate ABC transporter permease [Eubacteriales bacterium]|jgi:putative aldouronate transport system permease protein